MQFTVEVSPSFCEICVYMNCSAAEIRDMPMTTVQRIRINFFIYDVVWCMTIVDKVKKYGDVFKNVYKSLENALKSRQK